MSIAEAVAKHYLMYGEGPRDPLGDIELGWKVNEWLETQDDLDQLDDRYIDSMTGEHLTHCSSGWAPLKDCHWRDEGGFLCDSES